jgi:hypothetical protein
LECVLRPQVRQGTQAMCSHRDAGTVDGSWVAFAAILPELLH